MSTHSSIDIPTSTPLTSNANEELPNSRRASLNSNLSRIIQRSSGLFGLRGPRTSFFFQRNHSFTSINTTNTALPQYSVFDPSSTMVSASITPRSTNLTLSVRDDHTESDSLLSTSQTSPPYERYPSQRKKNDTTPHNSKTGSPVSPISAMDMHTLGLLSSRTDINSYSFPLQGNKPWATLVLSTPKDPHAPHNASHAHVPRIFGGDILQGAVILDLDKPMAIHEIKLTLKGKMVVGFGGNYPFLAHTMVVWNRTYGNPRVPLDTKVPWGRPEAFTGKCVGYYELPFEYTVPTETNRDLGPLAPRNQDVLPFAFTVSGVNSRDPELTPHASSSLQSTSTSTASGTPHFNGITTQLPSSVRDQSITATVTYELYLQISHGTFRRETRIATDVTYVPSITPPALPPCRAAVYDTIRANAPHASASTSTSTGAQYGAVIHGPFIDPGGWLALPPVIMNGFVRDTQKPIHVECVLSYTRGTIIPCFFTLSSDDTQILDTLSSPSAPCIRLTRAMHHAANADTDYGQTRNLALATMDIGTGIANGLGPQVVAEVDLEDALSTEEVGRAVWWVPQKGQEDCFMHTMSTDPSGKAPTPSPTSNVNDNSSSSRRASFNLSKIIQRSSGLLGRRNSRTSLFFQQLNHSFTSINATNTALPQYSVFDPSSYRSILFPSISQRPTNLPLRDGLMESLSPDLPMSPPYEQHSSQKRNEITLRYSRTGEPVSPISGMNMHPLGLLSLRTDIESYSFPIQGSKPWATLVLSTPKDQHAYNNALRPPFPRIFGGDILQGVILLDLDKPMAIHEIKLTLKGKVVVSFGGIYPFLAHTMVVWNKTYGDPRASLDTKVPWGRPEMFRGKFVGYYELPFKYMVPTETNRDLGPLSPRNRRNQLQALPFAFTASGVDSQNQEITPNTYPSLQSTSTRFDGMTTQLPSSLRDQYISSTVQYELYLQISHGTFRRETRISTHVTYVPSIIPAPLLPSRAAVYDVIRANAPSTGTGGQYGAIVQGPFTDPVGWLALSSVIMNGFVTDMRKPIHVECVLYLARPLSYTRGTVIPCFLTLSSDDAQILDTLSSPSAPCIRLMRTVRHLTNADKDYGHTQNLAFAAAELVETKSGLGPQAVAEVGLESAVSTKEVGRAVWWVPQKGQGDVNGMSIGGDRQCKALAVLMKQTCVFEYGEEHVYATQPVEIASRCAAEGPIPVPFTRSPRVDTMQTFGPGHPSYSKVPWPPQLKLQTVPTSCSLPSSFIALLAHNQPPSPADINHINEFRGPVFQTLVQRKRSPDWVKRPLKMQLFVCDVILSPFRHLHNDILYRIALYCPRFSPPRASSSGESHNIYHSPSILIQVCKAWREAVYPSSILWSDIRMSSHIWDYKSLDILRNRCAFFAKLSRTRPLSVHLCQTARPGKLFFSQASQHDFISALNWVWNAWDTNGRQITRLILSVQWDLQLDRILSPLIPWHGPVDGSIVYNPSYHGSALKSLRIEGFQVSTHSLNSFEQDLVHLLNNLPNLTHLSLIAQSRQLSAPVLTFISDQHRTWKSLKTIHLFQALAPSDVCALLQSCPNLEVAALAVKPSQTSEDVTENRLSCYTQIKELHLTFFLSYASAYTHGSGFSASFSALRFPNLQVLKVDWDYDLWSQALNVSSTSIFDSTGFINAFEAAETVVFKATKNRPRPYVMQNFSNFDRDSMDSLRFFLPLIQATPMARIIRVTIEGISALCAALEFFMNHALVPESSHPSEGSESDDGAAVRHPQLESLVLEVYAGSDVAFFNNAQACGVALEFFNDMRSKTSTTLRYIWSIRSDRVPDPRMPGDNVAELAYFTELEKRYPRGQRSLPSSFIALLAHNHPPLAAEVANIKEFRDTAVEKLAQFKDRDRNRYPIEMQLFLCDVLLSPFRHLPNDILYQIAAYCPRFNLPTPSSDESYRIFHTPSALIQVCKAWREVVFHSPVFWTDINMRSRTWSPERFEILQNRCAFFAQQSGTLPLSIHLCQTASPWYTENEAHPETFIRAFDWIWNTWNTDGRQITRLILSLKYQQHVWLDRFMTPLIPGYGVDDPSVHNPSYHASALKSLRIDGVSGTQNLEQALVRLHNGFPNLTHLALIGERRQLDEPVSTLFLGVDEHKPWSLLETICLTHSFTISAVCALLQWCPNLEVAALVVVPEEASNAQTASNTNPLCSFTQMRMLHLTFLLSCASGYTSGSGFSATFRTFRFPNLHTLKIDWEYDTLHRTRVVMDSTAFNGVFPAVETVVFKSLMTESRHDDFEYHRGTIDTFSKDALLCFLPLLHATPTVRKIRVDLEGLVPLLAVLNFFKVASHAEQTSEDGNGDPGVELQLPQLENLRIEVYGGYDIAFFEGKKSAEECSSTLESTEATYRHRRTLVTLRYLLEYQRLLRSRGGADELSYFLALQMLI
ncbi:hypothetical protein CVT24_001634 [Panaeolus cyanescens]|uniref:Uncharacterized protein n=1 Tax=Panaeolus cyanescens TaxID=181874 RepID=A0A409YF69_9AGAR|nr:hypothetical protein CVT24_001634 [Panaeolus cyanescens]